MIHSDTGIYIVVSYSVEEAAPVGLLVAFVYCELSCMFCQINVRKVVILCSDFPVNRIIILSYVSHFFASLQPPLTACQEGPVVESCHICYINFSFGVVCLLL